MFFDIDVAPTSALKSAVPMTGAHEHVLMIVRQASSNSIQSLDIVLSKFVLNIAELETTVLTVVKLKHNQGIPDPNGNSRMQ